MAEETGKAQSATPVAAAWRNGPSAIRGDVIEGAGCVVYRERLVRRVLEECATAGIVFVCAPQGFGKTALLLQCAAAIEGDPARGVAVVINAAPLTVSELCGRLASCVDEFTSEMIPHLLVDDLPLVDAAETEMLVSRLRELRDKRFRLVVACTPANRPFMSALGDSAKVTAQAMRVQPREYAVWAHLFSISSSLDVYALTQGVPALVAALRAVTTTGPDGMRALEAQAVRLYRAILEEAGETGGRLHRLFAIMLLLGGGTLAELDRCGVRVRSETVVSLTHDYPVFGVDATTRKFSCLASRSKETMSLRAELAEESPRFLEKAVRIHMRAQRVDAAIQLMDSYMPRDAIVQIVDQFPVQFALTGHAPFVRRALSGMEGARMTTLEIGVVLAFYVSALTMGDYRLARASARELARRASEVQRDIAPGDWCTARAFRRVWGSCSGIDLPEMPDSFRVRAASEPVRDLLAHARVYGRLVGGAGDVDVSEMRKQAERWEDHDELNVPHLLIYLDLLLDEALNRGTRNVKDTDEELRQLERRATERRLMSLVGRVRLVASVRRLLAGLPVVDERAFNDAGTMAVRESDLPTQLFCLLCEGWQALTIGQLANALFRGQQVLKLATEEQGFLRSWAYLLERSAMLLNSPRIGVRDEAELIDLSVEVTTPAQAWSVALHLSSARFDSDLSVWFSMNKDLLLDERFRPLARLAMFALGERADSVRRLLPSAVAEAYALGTRGAERAEPLFEVVSETAPWDAGMASIGLFGGFSVVRAGHVMTDELWRQRKVCVLAARLTLCIGTYVCRSTLIDEMWPQIDYKRARQNLYATSSALRRAFHQTEDGPQYVLTQGDGLALNGEFISSDVVRFELLAREILLKRMGMSSREVIESCLKLEQIYRGPLFVPQTGDATFFMHQRLAFASRYVDCLLRGIDAAVEEEDLPTASWLVDAALKLMPVREDLLRRAMRVFALCGRKREAVELYGTHLGHLGGGPHGGPDEETRRVYEEITGERGCRILLAQG